mgnify:CR=1 FL=1
MYDPPVYGEKGVPSSDNQPGARHNSIGCYDHITQEFWLFGGSGYITASGVLQLDRKTILMTNFSHRSNI